MRIDEDKLEIVLEHMFSLHEAEAILGMLDEDSDFTGEDIYQYIDWCRKRYELGEDTEFESWLDDRKPRVRIEIFVTECGTPIHEELEFPKRGEDMEHGTEFEWYYSLREVTDEIMALKVGESMNFKIRDDQKSHGTILRIA